jgi:hypothetical protein
VGWAAESHALGSGFLTPAHSLSCRSKHWQPRDPPPQPLKTTPLHTHTIPTSSFYSCVFHQKPLSTHSRPVLKWIRPKSAAAPLLPPAPGRGRTVYNRKERFSSVTAPLTATLRRLVTLGLSFLPFRLVPFTVDFIIAVSVFWLVFDAYMTFIVACMVFLFHWADHINIK